MVVQFCLTGKWAEIEDFVQHVSREDMHVMLWFTLSVIPYAPGLHMDYFLAGWRSRRRLKAYLPVTSV